MSAPEPIPLSSAKAEHYNSLIARLSLGKASQYEAITAVQDLCRDNERLALRSQASVAAALEAAAKLCDEATAYREKQLTADGGDEATRDRWRGGKVHATLLADAIRALITPDQRTALAAHVAAEVADAKLEMINSLKDEIARQEGKGGEGSSLWCVIDGERTIHEIHAQERMDARVRAEVAKARAEDAVLLDESRAYALALQEELRVRTAKLERECKLTQAQVDRMLVNSTQMHAKFDTLSAAAQALGAMPEGYCFCSKDRIGDDSKIHEPECRDLRAALAQIGAKP